jgi:hypothetical protein
MKTLRNLSVVILLFATMGDFAVSSAAEPSLTSKQVAADVQSEINVNFPGDRASGERTTCAYQRNDVKVGYVFNCSTFAKSGAKLTATMVTIASVQGNDVRWNFTANPARITYVITGTPVGATATIALWGPNGSRERSGVHLPFSISEAWGAFVNVTGNIISSSRDATLTCVIEVSGLHTIRRTSTGPNAVVNCGNR